MGGLAGARHCYCRLRALCQWREPEMDRRDAREMVEPRPARARISPPTRCAMSRNSRHGLRFSRAALSALGHRLSGFVPSFVFLYRLFVWQSSRSANGHRRITIISNRRSSRLLLGLLISNLIGPAALDGRRISRRVLCQDRHRSARRDIAVRADRLGGPGGDFAGLDRLDRHLSRDICSGAPARASTSALRPRSAQAARYAAFPARSRSRAQSARKRNMRR